MPRLRTSAARPARIPIVASHPGDAVPVPGRARARADLDQLRSCVPLLYRPRKRSPPVKNRLSLGGSFRTVTKLTAPEQRLKKIFDTSVRFFDVFQSATFARSEG